MQTGDANGPSWSVCVGAWTGFASRSGLPGQGAQRRDASYPTLDISVNFSKLASAGQF
jgi:hypothetical protein